MVKGTSETCLIFGEIVSYEHSRISETFTTPNPSLGCSRPPETYQLLVQPLKVRFTTYGISILLLPPPKEKTDVVCFTFLIFFFPSPQSFKI